MLPQPSKFLFADSIVFRISRLHVRILELFEHCPLFSRVRWPNRSQRGMDPFCLRAQESEIVHVRRVKGAD